MKRWHVLFPLQEDLASLSYINMDRLQPILERKESIVYLVLHDPALSQSVTLSEI